jgi:hypothetical protein
MVGKASPSETMAWWTRAAQARRVARMLSPSDARLAEAYARECEDHACKRSPDGVQQDWSASLWLVANSAAPSVGPAPPKQVLFRASQSHKD